MSNLSLLIKYETLTLSEYCYSSFDTYVSAMVVLLVIVLMEAHWLLVLWPYQMNLAMIHFGGLMLKEYFDRHLKYFRSRRYQSCCFGHDHRLRLSHFAVHGDLHFGF